MITYTNSTSADAVPAIADGETGMYDIISHHHAVDVVTDNSCHPPITSDQDGRNFLCGQI